MSSLNETFLWFIGKVESTEDPSMIGRVRVRIFNVHDDIVPAEELPYATPIMPPISSGHKGFGFSPTGLAVGSIVVGFFMDPSTMTMPMIMGTIAGVPDGVAENNDVPAEARGRNTATTGTTGPEPSSSYGAQYPYNFVYKSRTGHILEIDDTPNAERVHLRHAKGSYIEMRPDGSVTVKSVKDKVDVTEGRSSIYTGGKMTIHSDKINITNGDNNIHQILYSILDVLQNLANGENWRGNSAAPLHYTKQIIDQPKILLSKIRTNNLFIDERGLLEKLL